MDRFEAMRIFAKVVETGSFTKAAQTLHISRTRATHLVQQLEARLQVSLLNRTTRKVSVTSAGALYFERVVQLLADLEDSERDLAQALASPSGRLRVDVPSPLASRVLVPALPSFYARYPDIQLDMGVGDKTVDLLDESMDCVVRGGQIQDQSLIARRVGVAVNETAGGWGYGWKKRPGGSAERWAEVTSMPSRPMAPVTRSV